MGQGKKRKPNDRQPVPPKANIIAGGDMMVEEKEVSVDMCLSYFEEEISNSSILIDGLPITLDEIEGIFYIVLSGTKLKILNKKHSTMVKNCREMGVYYRGNTHITNSGKVYAKFIRNS